MEQGNPGGQEGKDWKRKTAEAAALSLAAGAIFSVGFEGTKTVREGMANRDADRNPATLQVEPVEPEICPPIDANVATQVARKLKLPAPTDLPTMNPEFRFNEWERFQQEYHAYASERAQAHGFELVDDYIARHKIKDAPDVDGILLALNGYTQEIGFNVVMRSPASGGMLPVDEAKFRFGADAMVTWLHFMPLELLETIDVKSVTINEAMAPMDNPVIGHAETAASMGMASGEMNMSMATFYGSDFSTFNHELGHRLDYKTCKGNAFDDKEFKALNTKNFEYGKPKTADLHLNVYDPYGATSAVEDKATLYAQMLNGLKFSMANERPDRINEKYVFLLDRLDQKLPGIAAYLSELGGGANEFSSPKGLRYSNTKLPANPYEKDQLSNYIQKRKPDKVG